MPGSSIAPQDLQYHEVFTKRGGPSYAAAQDQYGGIITGSKEQRNQGQLKKMVAAYNGPQDQALKGSGKKKSDLMKLYFSKQQNTNTSGGTESLETLDSQSKQLNGGVASANVGRS